MEGWTDRSLLDILLIFKNWLVEVQFFCFLAFKHELVCISLQLRLFRPIIIDTSTHGSYTMVKQKEPMSPKWPIMNSSVPFIHQILNLKTGLLYKRHQPYLCTCYRSV